MNSVVSKSLGNSYNYPNSLSAPPHGGKRLGENQDTGVDYVGGCLSWLEQNATLIQQVHEAMMSGNTQGLGMSDADIQTLLGYEQYANSVAYGSNWGGGVGAPGSAQPPVPGNMWYDSEEATITASGDGTTHNSSAYDNTLNVPSTAAEVTYDVTTDTRTTPAVEVLRVTIKNKMTGKEDVVFFDHFRDPDFSLTINTPKGKNVTGNSDGVPVTVGEFDINGGTGGVGNGIEGGEVEEDSDDHFTVVAGSGSVINAFPPEGADATQHFDIYGEFNLNLAADQEAYIDRTEDGNYVIKVKARDGTVIAEYTVMKGFPVQVNHDNFKNNVFFVGPGGTTPAGDWMDKNEDGDEVLHGPLGFNDLNIDGFDVEPRAVIGDGFIVDNISNRIGTGEPVSASGPVPPPKANPEPLENLAAAMGVSYGPEFYSKMFAAYQGLSNYDVDGDGMLNPEELGQAYLDGFILPPETPDANFLKFVGSCDPELAALIQDSKDNPLLADQNHSQMRDRLIELLDGVYDEVQTVITNADLIKVDGHDINFVDLMGM